MNQENFPLVFAVRLGNDEARFLNRLARENERSRSAEIRRLIRQRMLADATPTVVRNFGRM